MQKLRDWLSVLVVSLAVVGCSETQDPDAPPATLNVGHVGHDHQIALYYAALVGESLRAEGGPWLKEVKERQVYDLMRGDQPIARLLLHKVGGGSRMPTAMAAGEIDVGLGGVAAIAKARDNGHPIKVLAPLQVDGDFLAVSADSPIRTWEDFAARARSTDRPLVIGYKAPFAIAKLIFTAAMDAEGIGWTDQSQGGKQVQLRNLMRESSPIALLERGQIDGIVWNQPAIAIAEHKGVARAVIALGDLPPKGKWKAHPCCVLGAAEATIAEHPEALSELLKVIVLATQEIQRDPQRAASIASQWIRTRPEIEAASVPTVTYLAEPTDSWLEGIKTWHGLMAGQGGFQGRYKNTDADAFVADLCDLRLIRQVLTGQSKSTVERP